MNTIRVSQGELDDTASQLSRGAAEIERQLSVLRSNVERLGTSWEGAGSAGFHELFGQWITSASKLHEALEGISTLLKKAANVYTTTDEDVSRIMRQG